MSKALSNHELVMLGGLATTNIALNRLVPEQKSREIPANIAAAAAMLALASTVGTRSAVENDDDPGLFESLQRGVKAGLAIGVPIGTVLTLAPFFPPTRGFFHDDRIAGALLPEASYHFLARIPIGTALCEELIFRIAVPRILQYHRSPLAAELIGAGLFGLWHVLPALDRLHSNPGTASVHRRSPAMQAVIVAANVGATAGAGFALSKLRRASGSIAAPILVHAAINGGGYLGGWLSSRLTQPSSDTRNSQPEPLADTV